MDAGDWLASVLTIVVAIFASGGFWAYLQHRDTRKNSMTQLLLGLAHDRIIFLGMSYIDRGWVTKDEYEDFVKYLWIPYSAFGGNGLAEKVKNEVDKLPMQGVHKNNQIRLVKESDERYRASTDGQ